MLNQNIQIVKLGTDQYAQIDTERNLVTVHHGQRTGNDQDWGGACVASLSLDQALAIAEAVQTLKLQHEAALFLAAEDDAILAWAARLDEERENAHDLVSSSFGHD